MGSSDRVPTPAADGFFADVYALVMRVPRGKVTTYGAIAMALGRPQGARQVGWAMAALPHGEDDEVPAHRVVNASGGVSGGWSAAVRRAMLEDEGVAFDERGRVRLERHFWDPQDEVPDERKR